MNQTDKERLLLSVMRDDLLAYLNGDGKACERLERTALTLSHLPFPAPKSRDDAAEFVAELDEIKQLMCAAMEKIEREKAAP